MKDILEIIKERNIEIVFSVKKSWGHGGVPEYRGICKLFDYNNCKTYEFVDLEWNHGMDEVFKNLKKNIISNLNETNNG